MDGRAGAARADGLHKSGSGIRDPDINIAICSAAGDDDDEDDDDERSFFHSSLDDRLLIIVNSFPFNSQQWTTRISTKLNMSFCIIEIQ